MNNRIFIQAATQISMQQPLSEQWMTDPVLQNELLVKAVNPVFRDFIPVNEARRMGSFIKRAIVTSLKVLKDSGMEHPDAIVTGTSIGSLEYTERILDGMTENGEESLSPTFFMQSTHNTVGSAIAIYTKTHGYNTTYSHGQLSFDLALRDAEMQLQMGTCSTALVGGHDEMTEAYFTLLQKTGYLGQEGMVACGEVAVSVLLTADNTTDRLCELAGIRIFREAGIKHCATILDTMLQEAGMTTSDISAIMTGINGNKPNDRFYADITQALFPDKPLLRYKHLFGENYTASAFGVYATAQCLKTGTIPACLTVGAGPVPTSPTSILLINQMNGKDISFTLLKK